MGVGEGSPFAEYLARYLSFLNPPQILLNILHSPTAIDDLLTPDIAWWYASYPCGKYNTSSSSFMTDHPPSYSATESTARS